MICVNVLGFSLQTRFKVFWDVTLGRLVGNLVNFLRKLLRPSASYIDNYALQKVV